ncbi:amino acid adenylation domain-containing protein [Kitasatospora sp. NBC_01287]|uniref:non-ribosomal peptide synthetase n=1 Tax=Kitasatospora sp. NBC_01287 TaxID=2903573 RepID=UPI002252EDF7|nr:non-ribosomal peptide synthetase [Kitasatospora sp. NBC_01287]MCX4750032.1 amino acid adenylation domain-containing protein [Kitasatospora sp. NBC_01287]
MPETVHQLFRAQAARRPTAAAVVTQEGALSYRELDRRGDRLARDLRGLGVRRGTVVPVCLPRGLDLVVALLAVLKAGGHFLPLDPGYPARRLVQLVADSGAGLVLTDRALEPHFTPCGVHPVLVEEHRSGPHPIGAEEVPDRSGPGDPAYLVYTSGTTGTPKGVLVTHGALLFTVSRVTAAYGLTPADRVLQLAALGFDTALEQIFATLLSGATLLLGGPAGWAPTDLLERLPALDLTVADLTPAYWHQFLSLLPEFGPAPAKLRLLIVGGDTVRAGDCRTCLRRLPGTRLLNAYGVTEAAVTSLLWTADAALLHAEPAAPVPIGRPLPGVRVHLLDAELRPVRPGERGEIHLGGPGLALGYWRRPGLTAERFLPDPYADAPGERMYRTGDAGRWRPDGELELLGRLDEQVKVRGFRVDPIEVESVLAAHHAVRLVRVCPRENGDGERTLTAYYTLAERGDTDADARRIGLRRYLAERLPEFMVPAEFVLLDRMPLTPAGKIDRGRLPRTEPQLRRRAEDGAGDWVRGRPGGSAATGAVRLGVAQLWSEVLGVERVGDGDDFFELGGNSLLLMEMLARARIMFGIEVTWIRFLTRSLLRDASLGGFAAAVETARAGAGTAAGQSVDLVADTALTGVPVRTSGRPLPRRDRPAELLLTGATGFCGTHLLATLLATTDARIHCLVRAPDAEHGLERLRAAHQRFLRRDLVSDRVLPLVGDLTEPRLGLTERRFAELADSLDAIHHLGGQVNFIYPYHQLRAANVTATREVVRLAGHSRGIPVHYLSSLAVLAGFGAVGVPEVTEETPLDHAQHLGVGYVESKWAAEALLHNAAAAGLPVSIVRTNDVTGGLTTGVLNTGTELCALIKYVAESGRCPDVRLPLDFVPADRFSQAFAYLAAHARAAGDVYHVVSPRPPLLGALAERLRAHGYPVEQVPYPAWVEGLVRFAAGHPTHPMTPFVPLFVDRAPGTELSISEMYFRPTFPRFGRWNAAQALRGSGIELPPVDDALLDLYLDQLRSAGWLAPPPVPGAGQGAGGSAGTGAGGSAGTGAGQSAEEAAR